MYEMTQSALSSAFAEVYRKKGLDVGTSKCKQMAYDYAEDVYNHMLVIAGKAIELDLKWERENSK